MTAAHTLPGPSELLSGGPDAVVNLQTAEGLAVVAGQWRYGDARVAEVGFVEVAFHLGPGDVPNTTYEVLPHAESPDYDDSDWPVLAPEDTMRRLSTGRVCFNWYRLRVTVPECVGDLQAAGSTVVFEVVVDDYAEVWVDGRLPLTLGMPGGQVVSGFNAPNRVVLGTDVRPGQTFTVAVFGINGPISIAPANYIWMRSATLDFYRPGRAEATETVPLDVVALDAEILAVIPDDSALERVAGGFAFTEGPVWNADDSLLFSSPNTNTIYRWAPPGIVSVFRAKSGYAGADISRYEQPGSNGLTFDPQGRLVVCQHGNRRVLRVNPHGDTTVLADTYDGRNLNSPNDVVVRSDGTVYFTDPPFGLPAGGDDPKRELPFSGVYRVREGEPPVLLTAELEGPNGLAFSPDERFLYVGNWDLQRKTVTRYAVSAEGDLAEAEIFADLTFEPGDDAVDGLKVDTCGRIYVCGPGGIWIFAPDGRRIALLRLPESPHNLAWGDRDGRTLYVTALTSIYRIRLSVAGVRPVTKEDS
jgi:gluconolactonase